MPRCQLLVHPSTTPRAAKANDSAELLPARTDSEEGHESHAIVLVRSNRALLHPLSKQKIDRQLPAFEYTNCLDHREKVQIARHDRRAQESGNASPPPTIGG